MLEPLEDRRMLAVITVNTVDDIANDGLTSLGEAVLIANRDEARDEIVFNFGDNDPRTILLSNTIGVGKPVSIVADGQVTIDGGTAGNIFSVSSDFWIEGVTLTNAVAAIDSRSGFDSTIVVRSSMIVDNYRGIDVGGDLFVVSSTVARNDNGGIYGDNVTLINSTLSENSSKYFWNSPGVHGGTLVAGIRANHVELYSSTVTKNAATVGNWSRAARTVGGISATTISLSNSIVAGNRGQGNVDISSDQINAKNSLIGDRGDTSLEESRLPDADGNMVGGAQTGKIDPMLGPLRDNGSSIWTYALLPDSPAIDRGNIDLLLEANDRGSETLVDLLSTALEADARGDRFSRVAGDQIDMGAHERQSLTATVRGLPASTFEAIDEVVIEFSQPVDGFGLHNLRLFKDGDDTNLLTGKETLESEDERAYVLRGLPRQEVFGGYTLTIDRDGISTNEMTLEGQQLAGQRLDSSIEATWFFGRSESTIVVNTLVDEQDGDIYDGDISLRDALAASFSGDTIRFAAELNGGAITLDQGTLDVEHSLTIDASDLDEGPTLGFDPRSRLRIPLVSIDDGDMWQDSPVTIRGLTLANAKAGAVVSDESLSIESSYLHNNIAMNGAAIYVDGSVSIVDSVIADNRINSTFAHATDGFGGGVYATGYVNVKSSEFLRNRVEAYNNGAGAAIYSVSEVYVESSTISGNVSASLMSRSQGFGSVVGNTVHVVSSTLANNHTTGSGAALHGETLVVESSTFSNNYAEQSCGAIDAVRDLAIRNSTITNNASLKVGGVCGGVKSISTSIIANNHIIGRRSDESLDSPDINSVDTFDISYSLIGDTGTSGLTESPVGSPDPHGNLIGGPTHGVIDPKLDRLQDNGGPTMTHALLPDSPAIDTGSLEVAGIAIPPYDQRGVDYVRAANEQIDMGAQESQSLTAQMRSIEAAEGGADSVVTIEIAFSEPVSRFDLSNLTLTRNGHPQNQLHGTEQLEGDASNRIYLLRLDRSWDDGAATPEGLYMLTLSSSQGFQSDSGNTLDSSSHFTWSTRRDENTITVDTNIDEADGRIDDGDISLRDAIGASRRGDTILFSPELDGETILLTMGQLEIDQTLTLDATGLDNVLKIDANGRSRVLRIDDHDRNVHNPVALRGLSFTNGESRDSGGGIWTSEDIVLDSSRVSSNQSMNKGGGIYSQGSVSVLLGRIGANCVCRPSGAFSTEAVGGAQPIGGGIYSFADVTLDQSTLADNHATFHYFYSDDYSRDDGNTGGIHAAKVTLRNSTMTGNRDTQDNGHDGGIWANEIVVEQSTIGPVLTQWTRAADELLASVITIRSSTVTSTIRTSSLDARNSILVAVSNREQPGIEISNSYFTQWETLPGLGRLRDNGGPTWTRALLPNSRAIDRGDSNAQPGVDGVPEFDQRGNLYERIAYGTSDVFRMDAGAFELGMAGDLDGDGVVAFSDFLVFSSKYGAENINVGWHQGNFNGDDLIDFEDFRLLSDNFGVPV